MPQTMRCISLAFALASVAGLAIAGDGARSPAGEANACVLLSDKEIESVQGERPVETKATRNVAELAVSQCYFALPTASKSISLSLTGRGAGVAARDPIDAWRKMFATEKRERGEAREDHEERERKPERIARLGDAAYWSAGPVGGVLWVLRGGYFVRISVGGPDTVAQKKTKSITLARFVLRRL